MMKFHQYPSVYLRLNINNLFVGGYDCLTPDMIKKNKIAHIFVLSEPKPDIDERTLQYAEGVPSFTYYEIPKSVNAREKYVLDLDNKGIPRVVSILRDISQHWGLADRGLNDIPVRCSHNVLLVDARCTERSWGFAVLWVLYAFNSKNETVSHDDVRMHINICPEKGNALGDCEWFWQAKDAVAEFCNSRQQQDGLGEELRQPDALWSAVGVQEETPPVAVFGPDRPSADVKRVTVAQHKVNEAKKEADAVAVEIQATFVLESGGTKLRQAEMQLDSSVLRDASGVIDYKHMETSPDTLALQVSTDLAPQMSLPPAVLNMESASTPKITPKKRKQASEVVVVERPAKKQKGWAPKGDSDWTGVTGAFEQFDFGEDDADAEHQGRQYRFFRERLFNNAELQYDYQHIPFTLLPACFVDEQHCPVQVLLRVVDAEGYTPLEGSNYPMNDEEAATMSGEKSIALAPGLRWKDEKGIDCWFCVGDYVTFNDSNDKKEDVRNEFMVIGWSFRYLSSTTNVYDDDSFLLLCRISEICMNPSGTRINSSVEAQPLYCVPLSYTKGVEKTSSVQWVFQVMSLVSYDALEYQMRQYAAEMYAMLNDMVGCRDEMLMALSLLPNERVPLARYLTTTRTPYTKPTPFLKTPQQHPPKEAAAKVRQVAVKQPRHPHIEPVATAQPKAAPATAQPKAAPVVQKKQAQQVVSRPVLPQKAPAGSKKAGTLDSHSPSSENEENEEKETKRQRQKRESKFRMEQLDDRFGEVNRLLGLTNSHLEVLTDMVKAQDVVRNIQMEHQVEKTHFFHGLQTLIEASTSARETQLDELLRGQKESGERLTSLEGRVTGITVALAGIVTKLLSPMRTELTTALDNFSAVEVRHYEEVLNAVQQLAQQASQMSQGPYAAYHQPMPPPAFAMPRYMPAVPAVAPTRSSPPVPLQIASLESSDETQRTRVRGRPPAGRTTPIVSSADPLDVILDALNKP